MGLQIMMFHVQHSQNIKVGEKVFVESSNLKCDAANGFEENSNDSIHLSKKIKRRRTLFETKLYVWCILYIVYTLAPYYGNIVNCTLYTVHCTQNI